MCSLTSASSYLHSLVEPVSPYEWKVKGDELLSRRKTTDERRNKKNVEDQPGTCPQGTGKISTPATLIQYIEVCLIITRVKWGSRLIKQYQPAVMGERINGCHFRCLVTVSLFISLGWSALFRDQLDSLPGQNGITAETGVSTLECSQVWSHGWC